MFRIVPAEHRFGMTSYAIADSLRTKRRQNGYCRLPSNCRWSSSDFDARARATTSSIHLRQKAWKAPTSEDPTPPFLTCCDLSASADNGSDAHGMLVPIHCRVGAVMEELADHTPSPIADTVLDVGQHVLRQPTRMFAPGLAVTDTTAHLVVVDHEACRIATISDCWDEGFGELGVVVSVLLGLDIYSAGLSPLIRYDCPIGTGFTPISFIPKYLREVVDDAPFIGRTVDFIDEEPAKLIDSADASGGSIFSRSTGVRQLTRLSLMVPSSASAPRPSFVLKIQHNTPNCVESDARVLRMIEQRVRPLLPNCQR
ncbi:hypothetical protein MVLG_06140 [Microbotryum lychnidis-dioicae p1A1 Lamole]|uniref:Uncharacterized protein n=1 Tax=Microbotryum lychnidis-dioicae (strain p1A1 Lamole / MvSl-1064) TaxID=683840 RepID=U5HGC9_USTV1|nr:hypothetical protein MVLG_06140 [Microbotryum lychnidis-dioicae p1A1 Lamole]|eukprot:KDE03378.1 hypothetical protein MVLG_06140 [Microbotryum lychnidis-dioicae p1A1 Lamole]